MHSTPPEPRSSPGITPTSPLLSPGDEAAPGTLGTGDDTCPVCRGSGKTKDGNACMNCGGTGIITEGIGGG